MGALTELLLFAAAKRLYRTEIAQTSEMKSALSDIDRYDRFREGEAEKVLKALRRYGVSLRGRRIVDFGCNDGALCRRYLEEGASEVIGLDIDEQALQRARLLQPGVRFTRNAVNQIPLPDASADVVVSSDVFEHVAQPEPILSEMHRVIAPGGTVVIGTIGWRMPFAPHLWSTMPVPWAHLIASERSLLRACRRVYHSSWYRPNMHDLDAQGNKLSDKYMHEKIPTDYLNHYLVRDFESAFEEAGFRYRTDIVPIHGSSVLRPFCSMPWLRELVGGSVWFTLNKSAEQ